MPQEHDIFLMLVTDLLSCNAANETVAFPLSERDGIVWKNDHELAKCIKLLPADAGTSQVDSSYFEADILSYLRIIRRISPLRAGKLPVCALCEAIMPDEKKGLWLVLPVSPDAIAYHMHAK